MLLVLSPSKTLDTESWPQTTLTSQPEMLAESKTLITQLRQYKPADLQELMGISEKLAMLNVQRYQAFRTPFTLDNAKQALLMFKGDVYEGMEVDHYRKEDFTFAQEHVRILSGLYGLLRPLDLIAPYRLEMGTRLANRRGKDLYAFWGARITEALNKAMAAHAHKTLINLASVEYFKAVALKELDGRLLNIIFKEKQKGTLKIIGLFAKRARGLMADYMIRNRIDNINDIKEFQAEGYRYHSKFSSEDSFVFIR